MKTELMQSSSHMKPKQSTKREASKGQEAVDKRKEAGLTGVVTRVTSGEFGVRIDGRSVTCTLAPVLRLAPGQVAQSAGRFPGPPAKKGSHNGRQREKETSQQPDFIALGDRVQVCEYQEGRGIILEALPRQNKLARRSAVPMPGAHAHEQVIAANLDQAVPVFAAAEPPPKWNLLDRYLVSAEAAGVPALICISKSDLLPGNPDEAAVVEAIAEYQRIGYPVVLVSALTGEGLDELRQALRGRISALLGKSGVGKTSLLNALQPGLGLRVNAVSRVNGKGRHTTTHLEMFTLDLPPGKGESSPASETSIVDTPGIREFGLWEVSGEDLALYFPEMRPYIGRCRFGLDCRHNEEPDCAIRTATMAGSIHPRRYQSYQRLRDEAWTS